MANEGNKPAITADERAVNQSVEPPRPSVLVHNEQLKYTATLINTVAAGSIIAGFVAPLGSLAAGDASPWTILISLLWLPLGIALHLVARFLLNDLKEGP